MLNLFHFLSQLSARDTFVVSSHATYIPVDHSAPAELKKEGASYDLPIAVGLLIATEQLDVNPGRVLFLGELSLDGTLRHTDGLLCMAIFAREQGYETIFVPEIDAPEAALVEGVRVVPVPTLALLVAHLRGDFILPPAEQRPA